MSETRPTWTTESARVAGLALRVARAGSGPPLLVLHHDIGTLPALRFYDRLARDFTVLLPSHPGYDGSERPDWMRSVRDMAVVYQWLIGERGLGRDARGLAVVGLGFGEIGRASCRERV